MNNRDNRGRPLKTIGRYVVVCEEFRSAPLEQSEAVALMANWFRLGSCPHPHHIEPARAFDRAGGIWMGDPVVQRRRQQRLSEGQRKMAVEHLTKETTS